MKEFFNLNAFEIIISVICAIELVLYIASNIKIRKLRTSYAEFMKKLGNGENVEQMMKEYIKKVESIDKENKEIEKYCEVLKGKTEESICKIGLIRYNAFKDTGSNLSFALAMLNEENDGVVLNGIYSRDSSNIYCKTVKNGVSEYAVSEEEKEAIKKAVNYKKSSKA